MMWDIYERACVSTFVEETNPKAYFWILGDPFLRAFYSVYDLRHLRVGLLDISGPTTHTPAGPTTKFLMNEESLESFVSDLSGNKGRKTELPSLVLVVASAALGLLFITLLSVCACHTAKKLRHMI
jgi:hypothetical protein